VLDAAPACRLVSPEPDLFPRRCGSYWAVAQTHPQAERWAVANLQRQGYVTFLPLCLVRRRDRVTPTLWHTVEAPLFAGYLFVTVDRHWAPIAHTRGVRRLLMADAMPAIVANAEIRALEAVQALPAPPTPWEAGTPCSLAYGALAGAQAVVLDVHGEHATVAVLLFGALRQVVAPVAWLVARQ
jgi:transcriptional antiterminator RfaH